MSQLRKFESVITLLSFANGNGGCNGSPSSILSISDRNGKTIGGIWKKKKEILMEDRVGGSWVNYREY